MISYFALKVEQKIRDLKLKTSKMDEKIAEVSDLTHKDNTVKFKQCSH